jgi:hypothetical protein
MHTGATILKGPDLAHPAPKRDLGSTPLGGTQGARSDGAKTAGQSAVVVVVGEELGALPILHNDGNLARALPARTLVK